MTETQDQAVATQYEVLPYPAREPRDEARRLLTGSPSHLAEIEHYFYAGHIPRNRKFRALMAGGGTGDATIMLAQQTAHAGLDAEIVYLDMSSASRRIAEERAAVRGLTHLRFVTGSLLDLPTLGLGSFDYIDCCGVLHHLADPPAGLACLAASLASGGGMGLMLYGELGRSGVYELQETLRAIVGNGPPAERVAITRKLMTELPRTHWLKLNPVLGPGERDDTELFDLLLHARDRPYTVPDIADLLEPAGLRLVTFIEQASYDPSLYIKDSSLLRRLDALDPIERAATAELIAGNMARHVFYATHRANPVQPLSLEEAGMDAIPVLREVDGGTLADTIVKDRLIFGKNDGLEHALPMPRLAGAILRRIDGHATLRDIHAGLADPRLSETAFLAAFTALYSPLHGINRLLLRRSGPL